jgi:hypothetical protein
MYATSKATQPDKQVIIFSAIVIRNGRKPSVPWASFLGMFKHYQTHPELDRQDMTYEMLIEILVGLFGQETVDFLLVGR